MSHFSKFQYDRGLSPRKECVSDEVSPKTETGMSQLKTPRAGSKAHRCQDEAPVTSPDQGWAIPVLAEPDSCSAKQRSRQAVEPSGHQAYGRKALEQTLSIVRLRPPGDGVYREPFDCGAARRPLRSGRGPVDCAGRCPAPIGAGVLASLGLLSVGLRVRSTRRCGVYAEQRPSTRDSA